MLLPDYEELYAPYSKDASLDVTIEWITKQASAMRISDHVRDMAITETFLEMAQGKQFEVGNCHCKRCGEDGFPTEWSCVAMNHYLLDKMVDIKTEIAFELTKIIQKRTHSKMLSIIHTENEAYIKKNMMPRKSPILPILITLLFSILFFNTWITLP